MIVKQSGINRSVFQQSSVQRCTPDTNHVSVQLSNARPPLSQSLRLCPGGREFAVLDQKRAGAGRDWRANGSHLLCDVSVPGTDVWLESGSGLKNVTHTNDPTARGFSSTSHSLTSTEPPSSCSICLSTLLLIHPKFIFSLMSLSQKWALGANTFGSPVMNRGIRFHSTRLIMQCLMENSLNADSSVKHPSVAVRG